MQFKIVIPARLGSTRLPRKVLREVAGKPLIQHVWEAARRAGAGQIVVAVDDPVLAQAVESFGADACLTSAAHESGTDRVNEVAQSRGWDNDCIVVNLQGDEPLMPPELVREAAQMLDQDPGADIATLCHPIHDAEDWLNPNVVKLVMDRKGYAMYFSRAPIPWKRDPVSASSSSQHMAADLSFRHIGLYAYRVGRLKEFSRLPPAPLEACEALEQLRALHHGFRIRVGVTDNPPPRGVDTEADLDAVAKVLAAAKI